MKADRVRVIIFSLAAFLSLGGIAEATYLTALHLAGANVVCVGSADCSQVLRSAYASFHGVPLAAVGGLAYFVVFSSALLAAFGYRRAPQVLGLTIAAMFLTTLWLLYVQAYILHTFCDYCLLSAALIFLLAGVMIAAPKRA
jgi:uncharacterized membrane protein